MIIFSLCYLRFFNEAQLTLLKGYQGMYMYIDGYQGMYIDGFIQNFIVKLIPFCF